MKSHIHIEPLILDLSRKFKNESADSFVNQIKY